MINSPPKHETDPSYIKHSSLTRSRQVEAKSIIQREFSEISALFHYTICIAEESSFWTCLTSVKRMGFWSLIMKGSLAGIGLH